MTMPTSWRAISCTTKLKEPSGLALVAESWAPRTPHFWSDVGNGLGKRPDVTGKVLNGVLALAERICLGCEQHAGTVREGALVMRVDISYTNAHGVAGLVWSRRTKLEGLRSAATNPWAKQHHDRFPELELCSEDLVR